MPKVSNVFITGANRGIGLQLVKEILLKFKPTKLFATYRDEKNSKELFELAAQNKEIKTIQLDMTDFSKYEEIVKQVGAEVGDEGLNLLINNAGFASQNSVFQFRGGTLESENPILMGKEELEESFQINAVAPLLFTKEFYPLLAKGFKSNSSAPVGIERATVVNVSSIMGSIGDNNSGGYYSYRISKAALNAGTKALSFDFKKGGIEVLVIALHPGWVKTDMGGENATLTTEDSCGQIVDLLAKLDATHHGKFLQYDGKEIPW